MCLSATVILFLFITKTKATVEDHGDHFNAAYAPATVNFNEIFTNSLSLSEDPSLTIGTKDDDFHIHHPALFVEFRPNKQETTQPPPPPIFLLNSSYLKKENVTEQPVTPKVTSTTRLPSTSTTRKPEQHSVKVIPIQKRQRGVLDLILPPARVRSFKRIFDTFRIIMSHTFRKR